MFKAAPKTPILGRWDSQSCQPLLMLDVSDIHLLKTIAETGSINKAADVLFMSQPTLSKKVSRLEHVLKVELFHRHSTGMVPTDVTRYLISNGKQIQSKLEAMCRHVELLSNLEGGSLHIGVSPIIEQLFFPAVLLDFLNETQDVEISFKVDEPSALKQEVIDGNIDIAIGPFDIETLPNELVVREVNKGAIVFVVRASHPIQSNPTPIPYDALKAYKGIGPPLNASMTHFLEQRGLPTLLKIACDNYRISKSVVKASDYFTGGPRALFEDEIAAGELVELDMADSLLWQGFCVTRPESVNTPTVKKFLQVLTRHISE